MSPRRKRVALDLDGLPPTGVSSSSPRRSKGKPATLDYFRILDCGAMNETRNQKPCLITIQGLFAFHNAAVKFKLDKGEGNLAEIVKST
jgi:hypothetical protein